MMYEDTSLNSGTRYQQKLKFKKEQISKLQGQILDYQKSNLRKSVRNDKDSFSDFMNNNGTELSLRSINTFRKSDQQGYTQFKNSSMKLTNFYRILRDRKSSMNVDFGNFENLKIVTIVKIQSFVRGWIARFRYKQMKEQHQIDKQKQVIFKNFQFVDEVLMKKYKRVINLNVERILYIQSFIRMINVRRKYLKIIRDIRRDERFSKIQEIIDKKWLIKLFEDFRKYDRLKVLKQEKKRQLQIRQDRLSKLAQPKSPTAKVISFKTGSHGGTLEIPGTPHAHKKSLQSKNQISFGSQPQSCPPSPRSNRITMGQQYVVDSMNKENKKLQDQILDLTNKILKKKGLMIKAKRFKPPKDPKEASLTKQQIQTLTMPPSQLQQIQQQKQKILKTNNSLISGENQLIRGSSTVESKKVPAKTAKNLKKKKKAFITQYKEVFFKKIARKPKKHATNKFLDDNLELDKFSQIELNESKGQIDNDEEISPYELSS